MNVSLYVENQNRYKIIKSNKSNIWLHRNQSADNALFFFFLFLFEKNDMDKFRRVTRNKESHSLKCAICDFNLSAFNLKI